MKKKMECFWIRNTDRTLPALRRASRGVAMIPLTSIESHGPHLPLGSDTLCAEYLLRKVAARETVAILPILQYSYVADARMMPGAVHIRTDLLSDLVENICDEVGRNGFTKVVLLHAHGGNVTLDGAFTRRMLERNKSYMTYSISVLAGTWKEMAKLMETRELGHACEFETSLNLVACPELVNLKVPDSRHFPTHPVPAVGRVLTPVDWVAAHPVMAVGYPRKANARKGERVAEIWANGIVEDLRRIKKDRRGPQVLKDYNRRVRTVSRLS